MARVTAYEASDGTLHRDRKVYLRHEANLVVGKELKTIIANLFVGITDDAARQAKADELHDHIVNGIGLNTLRDLFAAPGKPAADDGDENGATTGGTEGAAAGDAGAQAQGSGEQAAAPAATPEAGSGDI